MNLRLGLLIPSLILFYDKIMVMSRNGKNQNDLTFTYRFSDGSHPI